jgi:hypothetical protein
MSNAIFQRSIKFCHGCEVLDVFYFVNKNDMEGTIDLGAKKTLIL